MTDDPIVMPATPDAEPPKHSRARALARFLKITIEQLGARFGVDRRTIYKWEERGCTFASIEGVRAWAHDSKISLRPSSDAFADVLGPISDGTKSALPTPAGQENIPLGYDDPEGSMETVDGRERSGGAMSSPSADLARASTQVKIRQTRDLDITIAQKEKLLFLGDDIHAMLNALGHTYIAELKDLPGLAIKNLPDTFPSDSRTDVRRAITAAAEQMRANVDLAVREAWLNMVKPD
jgi:transcriptional regulator with XRE-family HTH domain